MPRLPLLLALLLAACTGGGELPSPDDDDDATDDDDDTPDDDDDATDDDDDDITDDDDDATDDDDTTPPAPSTFIEFLEPVPGAELSGEAFFVIQTDGDNPGQVVWTLDGDEIGSGIVGTATLQAGIEIDTVEHPDGAYTVGAELVEQGGLSAELAVTFLNGDLVVYDWPPVVYDFDTPSAVTLQVPGPAVSLQFQVSHDPAVDDIEALWGPVYDSNGDWAIGGAEVTLYRVYAAGAEPWAGLIPNYPVATFPTGLHYLYPYADEGSTGALLTPRALVKRSFDPPDAGLLALDFYFSPGSGLSAASAPGDPNFIAFVDALESVLLEVGIGLGDVRYFDVGPSSYDSVTTYAELVDLFRQGVPSEDRVLDVFMVDDLDLPVGDAIGIAAHIPGPALANGTGQSGVAFESSTITSGDEWTAAALGGHEIGHYLGLFHTSEIGGGLHDPLGDTADSCDSSDCWETNLMNPYLYGTTALTDDQGWVLRRHPLVQLVDASELPARSWSEAAESGWSLPPEGLAGFCGTALP